MNAFDVPHPTLAIAGAEERFPVRRIYCIGRNYADHVREMGNDPERTPPVFFTKPPDAVVESGSSVPYPPRTADLHHEVELVVAIGKAGTDVAAEAAGECVFGYAVGLDLTRRDLQKAAKSAGTPWDAAKGFDGSAPVSRIHRVADVGHPVAGRIWLEVNGDMRQQGDLNELIWSVPESIAELSTLFALAPGDLIFTGTPSGVGALEPGDRIRAGIDGIDEIAIEIRE